jgi:hypothetical protein
MPSVEEDDGFDVDFETLFSKELKRRGLEDPAVSSISEKVEPPSTSQVGGFKGCIKFYR